MAIRSLSPACESLCRKPIGDGAHRQRPRERRPGQDVRQRVPSEGRPVEAMSSRAGARLRLEATLCEQPDIVAEAARPTRTEYGVAQREPAFMTGHGQATEQGQQCIRWVLAQQLESPCKEVGAKFGVVSSVGSRQCWNGRQNDLPQNVLAPETPGKPAVEKLLYHGVAAWLPLLRLDIGMEERYAVLEAFRNMSTRSAASWRPRTGWKNSLAESEMLSRRPT